MSRDPGAGIRRRSKVSVFCVSSARDLPATTTDRQVNYTHIKFCSSWGGMKLSFLVTILGGVEPDVKMELDSNSPYVEGSWRGEALEKGLSHCL